MFRKLLSSSVLKRGASLLAMGACFAYGARHANFMTIGHAEGFQALEPNPPLRPQVHNAYSVVEESVPEEHLAAVKKVLYGPPCKDIEITAAAAKLSQEHDFEIRAFKMTQGRTEAFRETRLVRVGAIQNQVVLPTTAPYELQYKAIEAKIEKLIDAAAEMGVNVLCLQEAWTAPFFFCTREKGWLEFAEPVDGGRSVKFIQRLAKKHNMVIVSPILERDLNHNETIWNTAVVVGNNGNVIGKHRKHHIPRVGDFNESTYYFEGNTGHPVFETKFGKIAINICYGRHFPQNWRAFANNGADIIFNPSATTDSLSETLWPIEARNAAIANTVFTVAINRVGSETFQNEFTSGNGKPAHHTFGHFYGSSFITGPNSQRTPPLSRVRDGLLVAEIDLNLSRQIKDVWNFQMCARDADYTKLFGEMVKLDYVPQVIKDAGEE